MSDMSRKEDGRKFIKPTSPEILEELLDMHRAMTSAKAKVEVYNKKWELKRTEFWSRVEELYPETEMGNWAFDIHEGEIVELPGRPGGPTVEGIVVPPQIGNLLKRLFQEGTQNPDGQQ